MFGIKPLKNKLLQLIENNESFPNFLKYSKFNGSMGRKMRGRYQDNCKNCTLSFFWENLHCTNINVRNKPMTLDVYLELLLQFTK